MSQSKIRQRYRGRVYLAPVLLDHSSLKWLWLSVFLLFVTAFLGGYIFGFEKAENRWLAKLDPMELSLPEVVALSQTEVEAQKPLIEEPGASIDVDSVDDPVADNVVAVIKPAVQVVASAVAANNEKKEKIVKPVQAVNEKVSMASPKVIVETAKLEDDKEDVVSTISSQVKEMPVSEDVALAMGGPPADNSGEVISTEALNIVDTATEETARYSIQMGVYSDFNNAENKVEELLNLNLSAYMSQYQNQKDETRYNVRFGHFSSFSSARQALNIYGQHFVGSGYITRLKR